ncbi:MAG: homoserine dehydrogenase, partial [Eggerthellaceae bacterium]|nr:homoserine dehydrogenase [Eggerthellaceae bacterium]
ILTIAGIMNGTTNYILSRMKYEGLSFDEVLKAAQDAGYAEADPTADVDGFDAASKIAILSSMGFRTRVTTDDVFMQGIRDVSAEDMQVAEELNCTIKLLAIARNTSEGIDVRVHPTMIPNEHPLARVDGAMNAVYVVGDGVGETMFYGAGAGSYPTASAVLGDVFALAEHISRGVAPLVEAKPYSKKLEIRSIDDLTVRYYVRLIVDDKPGVLAATTGVFAKHGVSISNVRQMGDAKDKSGVSLVFVTHEALEKDLRCAQDELAMVDGVQKVASIIRVENIDTWTQGVFDN